MGLTALFLSKIITDYLKYRKTMVPVTTGEEVLVNGTCPGAYPEISKGGGHNLKLRQLKLFWWDKLFCLYQLMQGFAFQPVHFATYHLLIL